MKKLDFLIYYKSHKKGISLERIVELTNSNKDIIKYKFELIDYHGEEWFKNTKLSWKCIHEKKEIIDEFRSSNLEYRHFCLTKGLYNLNSLKRWLLSFETIENKGEINMIDYKAKYELKEKEFTKLLQKYKNLENEFKQVQEKNMLLEAQKALEIKKH